MTYVNDNTGHQNQRARQTRSRSGIVRNFLQGGHKLRVLLGLVLCGLDFDLDFSSSYPYLYVRLNRFRRGCI